LPLYIVFIGSLVGIALLVGLNWLLGRGEAGLGKPARIADLETAREALDVDAVGFSAGQGVMSEDHRAALIEEAGGDRIAMIAARGDRLVIRYLAPGLVRDTRLDEDGALVLELNDFTYPRQRFVLGDVDSARDWADRLNELQA
jgi:hypothetical protein